MIRCSLKIEPFLTVGLVLILRIDILSMSDIQNRHTPLTIVNLVDDSVIS